MSEKRVRVIARGRVQGVGFRANCQREAQAVGVRGWVRNLWDGSVEALFEGPDDAVNAMVRWFHHGPRMAEVESVVVLDAVDLLDALETDEAALPGSFRVR